MAAQVRGRHSSVDAAVRQLSQIAATAAQTPTGKLPAERALAQALALSRGTIRAALVHLAQQGVVVSAPGAGWFSVAAPLSPPIRQLISFTDMARRRGQVVRTQVRHCLVRVATYGERASLELKGDGRVLDLLRLRKLDDRPVCLDHSIVSLGRVIGIDEYDFADRSLYEAIGACGEVPSKSEISLEAVPAGIWAPVLQMAPADPVVVAEEVTFGQYGAPILLGRAAYRADSYRFHATLTARSSTFV